MYACTYIVQLYCTYVKFSLVRMPNGLNLENIEGNRFVKNVGDLARLKYRSLPRFKINIKNQNGPEEGKKRDYKKTV